MRKPRDFDVELQALTNKARTLKAKKQSQLGELVAATGADALSIEQLAGALLDAATTTETGRKEAWRKRGASFFQSGARSRKSTGGEPGGASTGSANPQPPSSEAGAA